MPNTQPQEHSDPVPTQEERAAIEQYRKRRSRVPRMKISAPKNNAAIVTLDYHNQAFGAALIMQALGTGSTEFYQGVSEQLCNAVAANGKPDENAANFMLSVIEGMAPRDQMEAMLAAQMAAVHMANMRSAQRFANATSLESRDSAVRALNAFSRTYAAQMEALKRYRSTGEQKMTVEHQHVTVNEGGQAIVGNVTTAAGGGVAKNSEGQSHAKQLTHAPGETLPGTLEALRPAMSRTGR